LKSGKPSGFYECYRFSIVCKLAECRWLAPADQVNFNPAKDLK
jgi:hypothetical protein